jgi:hypothetical protein
MVKPRRSHTKTQSGATCWEVVGSTTIQLFSTQIKMFKTAVVASALLQVSSTKILESDHAVKAMNPQMVEAINVSFNHLPNATVQNFIHLLPFGNVNRT